MELLTAAGDAETSPPSSPSGPWSNVPWRTIIATIGLVVAVALAIVVVLATARILAWVLVAGFFAVVFTPPVRRVEARLGGRRGLATAIVLFSALAIVIGALAVFVIPVRAQLTHAITDLPGTVSAAAEGRGPVGHIVTQLHLERLVRDNQDTLDRAVSRLKGSSFAIARSLLVGVLTAVTIFVLTFFFLTQSKAMSSLALRFVPLHRRRAVSRAASDAAAAVSGYMIGNLLISVVAGLAAFICLAALGVPSPIVLALWVAFADLIPLVGATIGAAIAVLAAFLHSSLAGIVALVFFVLYQQFENSVLQAHVMSRAVRVNPLVVLLSVLLGVEMFGFLGALLAIPLAGATQVVAKAVYRERSRDQIVVPSDRSER